MAASCFKISMRNFTKFCNTTTLTLYKGHNRYGIQRTHVFKNYSVCTNVLKIHDIQNKRMSGVDIHGHPRTLGRSSFHSSVRLHSEAGPNKTLLMDHPQIAWPSFLKTIKNWFLTKLIIQPYIDSDFSFNSFTSGSVKAILQVSEILSKGNLEELEGLLTPDAHEAVSQEYAKLSMQERQLLHIDPKDVYFSFIYQIGLIIEDKVAVQKRLVEILMCCHIFRGYDEIHKEDPYFSKVDEHKERIYICNYRFVRNYTKGVEDQWTINHISYFKPANIR